MKFVAKFVLLILMIPVFFIFVLSINLRFQILSSDFWMNTFAKGNVYSQISDVIDKNMISKVEAGGGRDTDVTVLSNFVSPLNLKEFFEKNITSFLLYANGKADGIIVFAPLSLRNMQNISSLDKTDDLFGQMTLSEFMNEFNIFGVMKKDIQGVSRYGIWSWICISASLLLLILILILEYRLTDKGRHLTILGVSMVLCGSILLGASLAGNMVASILVRESVVSSSVGKLLTAIIAPPIIREVILVWVMVAFLSIVLGILLFFLKKPGITESK